LKHQCGLRKDSQLILTLARAALTKPFWSATWSATTVQLTHLIDERFGMLPLATHLLDERFGVLTLATHLLDERFELLTLARGIQAA